MLSRFKFQSDAGLDSYILRLYMSHWWVFAITGLPYVRAWCLCRVFRPLFFISLSMSLHRSSVPNASSPADDEYESTLARQLEEASSLYADIGVCLKYVLIVTHLRMRMRVHERTCLYVWGMIMYASIVMSTEQRIPFAGLVLHARK